MWLVPDLYRKYHEAEAMRRRALIRYEKVLGAGILTRWLALVISALCSTGRGSIKRQKKQVNCIVVLFSNIYSKGPGRTPEFILFSFAATTEGVFLQVLQATVL